MTDKPTNVRGRPTDFKPAMGEEILALMASGLSLAASAAELGIHRQRVYEWMERHPEFADTIKLAQAKRQLWRAAMFKPPLVHHKQQIS
jgi:transposase-like protein